jgi:hypothetical protein
MYHIGLCVAFYIKVCHADTFASLSASCGGIYTQILFECLQNSIAYRPLVPRGDNPKQVDYVIARKYNLMNTIPTPHCCATGQAYKSATFALLS